MKTSYWYYVEYTNKTGEKKTSKFASKDLAKRFYFEKVGLYSYVKLYEEVTTVTTNQIIQANSAEH